MPRARLSAVSLHYEVRGAGAPVLLIAGLGRALDLWEAQVAALASRFRVVAFDNRGVGASDAPPGPYTAAQMARDAVELLDHLDLASAHVVGASLGGFIAQEVALGWPERVRRLALLGTSFGSARCRRMAPEVWQALADRRGATAEEHLRRTVPLGFAPDWVRDHAGELARSIRARAGHPVDPAAWMAQAAAGVTFAAAERLPGLRVPTLVLAGTADIIVPPANAWLLARAIPGARLVLYPGAGHYFFIERADEVNRDLGAFLEEAPCPVAVACAS